MTYRLRPMALLAAIACGSGTALVLFADVAFRAAPLTEAHATTLIALLVTMTAGHMMLAEWRRPFAAVALAAVFLGGSLIIVSKSSGRGAEAMAVKAAVVEANNTERAAVAKKLKQAAEDFEKSTKASRAECATGPGPKCDGKKSNAERDDDYMQKLERKLKALAPEQKSNADLAYIGQLLAAVGIADAAKAEYALALVLPVTLTLILEIGCLTFASLSIQKIKPETVQRAISGPEIDCRITRASDGNTSGKRQKTTEKQPDGSHPQRQQTIAQPIVQLPQPTHPVLVALANAKRPLSNRELAKAMGVSQGEASKSWREVSDQLDIKKQGRELRIGLKVTSVDAK